MPEKKEPMIGQESRPTAIDFDMPIADFKLRDLYAIIHTHLQPEILKSEKEQFKEHLKPEKEKEYFKLEKEHFKEHLKPEKEKEYFKLEKEFKEHFKPEKEALKPEKELSKPEKPLGDPRVIDQIVTQVVERLKGQGGGR